MKGVKKIGVRLGNWLTAEQSQALWQIPGGERLKEKRDRALLAVLLACGLRRHEAVDLDFGHIQQRDEHWAIVDLKGKAGHTRTIPVPEWLKNVLDQWLQATSGKLFRRVYKMGKPWGEVLTEKAVWHVVGGMPPKLALRNWRRTTFAERVRAYATRPEVNWSRFNFS